MKRVDLKSNLSSHKAYSDELKSVTGTMHIGVASVLRACMSVLGVPADSTYNSSLDRPYRRHWRCLSWTCIWLHLPEGQSKTQIGRSFEMRYFHVI